MSKEMMPATAAGSASTQSSVGFIAGTQQADHGRARKVITRSGRGFRGKFPSFKLGRLVHWESILERDLILHLEYDPKVAYYQEQPTVVQYYDAQGNVRNYFPDFLVGRTDGSEFLAEAKPARRMNTPKVREKLAAVALRLKEKNTEFRVMTEDFIRRQPRFDNLGRIHDAVRSIRCLDRSLLAGLPSSISEAGTFGQLSRALGGERQLFLQYLAGNILLDVDVEWVDSTAVIVA